MPNKQALGPLIHRELVHARAARQHGDRDEAWRHLERAHILSQPLVWLHTRVHLSMLWLALATRDAREVGGQIIRVLVAGMGSALGRYPVGNTGRARVPLTQPMVIPPDLATTLASAGEVEHAPDVGLDSQAGTP